MDAPSPRREFFYFNDDGSLVALRYNQWKIVFAEQRAHGFDVWQEPFTALRLPKIFNLRSDPFEGADHEAMDYGHWRLDHTFVLVPAQQFVGQFLSTFPAEPKAWQLLDRQRAGGAPKRSSRHRQLTGRGDRFGHHFELLEADPQGVPPAANRTDGATACAGKSDRCGGENWRVLGGQEDGKVAPVW
jgi:hypothetical protein